MVEYGVALRHAFAVLLAELRRHVGVVDEREYIDEEPFGVGQREVFRTFNVEGVEVAHLHYGFACGFGLRCLQHKSLTEFLWGYLGEAACIGERHGYVDVVVPRYEAAVAHCTEQRTAVKPVGNAVLEADAVDFFEYGELLELCTAQLEVFELVEIGHDDGLEVSGKLIFSSRLSPGRCSRRRGCGVWLPPRVRA